jgi:predicted NAD-dependent protein-ADP-ribosyltransferase YbiA (DUF1768 family)
MEMDLEDTFIPEINDSQINTISYSVTKKSSQCFDRFYNSLLSANTHHYHTKSAYLKKYNSSSPTFNF